MSGRGNVRSGKCLSGEMSSRGSVLRGIARSRNCPFGEMSITGVSVGEVSVEELCSGKCQSGNCPVGELSSRGTVRLPNEVYAFFTCNASISNARLQLTEI